MSESVYIEFFSQKEKIKMSFNEACEYIKSRNLWDLFLEWFAGWFEGGMDNEEIILESTTLMYAESLKEM